MSHDRDQAAEPLSAFWNAVVSGSTSHPGGLDPELADTVLRLHAVRSAPRLPAALQDRIWSDLMASQPVGAATWTIPPSRPSSPNGRAPLERTSRQAALPGKVHWSAPHFATMALVLFTVLVSYLAFAGWRQGTIHLGPEPRPSLVAPVAAPTTATSAGPVAQFLWQVTGAPDLPFAYPSQPAIDRKGILWVPDSGHDRFLLFAPDGTFLEAWGTPGTDVGEFHLDDPRTTGIGFGGVAFDAKGNIYVADTGNYRVQKFGPDRTFITAWGSEGSGPGQFRRPIAIAVDPGGRVYVSDTGWGKVEVFDLDGKWLATWSGLGTPTGIAVDRDGNVWISEEGSGVVKFSPEGKRLATWDTYGTREGEFYNSISIAIDAEGRVFVADLSANRVQVFSPEGAFLGAWGERGDDAGQFRETRGIALDGNGSVYVTDAGGKRLQKFQLLPPLAPAASPSP